MSAERWAAVLRRQLDSLPTVRAKRSRYQLEGMGGQDAVRALLSGEAVLLSRQAAEKICRLLEKTAIRQVSPTNAQLIESAQRFPAPAEWLDEQDEPN